MTQIKDIKIALTSVGRRYDIVHTFSKYAQTIALDCNPLAPALYAADSFQLAPRSESPDFVPFLQKLCNENQIDAILPLSDPDIGILAKEKNSIPAFVCCNKSAEITFDKYSTYQFLTEHGFPGAPTFLPGDDNVAFPAIIKPRTGSAARSVFKVNSKEQSEFFQRYIEEPTVVQQLMTGQEYSVDTLCSIDGKCLNAIPRSIPELRGGESVKGTVLNDRELIELGVAVVEALKMVGPCMVQLFSDPEFGLGITDINARFGGGFPAALLASYPGRTYPELVVRMLRGETIAPHVGEFKEGITFSRYNWHVQLDSNYQLTNETDDQHEIEEPA